MNTGRGTVHPLAIPMRAGSDVLRRFGLNCESSLSDSIDDVDEYSEFLVSAHAPTTMNDMRLNIGAIDQEFRETSIRYLTEYIDKAHRYPNVRQVNMHPPPKQWLDDAQTQGRYGEYGFMIDAIRRIADHAYSLGIEVVLENNNTYWSRVPDDVMYTDVKWSEQNVSFGSAPEEWIAICQDTDKPNVGLCLDSSHVCTYAHTLPEQERRDAVMAFLSCPELIRHVHWNDNYLYDLRGRNDSHAVLSQGSLPLEMHSQIKKLDATLLIEHFYSIDDLELELEFISGL